MSVVGELGVRLADAVIHLTKSALPGDVEVMSQWTMLNVLGTTIGASRHRAVEITVNVGTRCGGSPTSTVPGRVERLDAMWAASAVGIAAHVADFDDTHLATVIHPGAATLGAVLSLGESRGASGAVVCRAFTLGVEAQLRIGVAMSPWHYDRGWHITGTCGVLGAAVAAGVVLGLDSARLAEALALAAGMTLGHREAFGTMEKAYHAGKAASNGVLAALLAERGATSASMTFEAENGFFAALSPRWEPAAVLDGWGDRWELLSNTFKPYPCGIVSHPAIDGAIALSSQVQRARQSIAQVTVRCNPLVVELTGNPSPQTGLEGKFSTRYGVAIGLLDGAASVPQYTDERVASPDAQELTARVDLVVDPAMTRDSSTVEVRLSDGSVLVHAVSHARGSLDNPLDFADLCAKVRSLVEPVLPNHSADLIREVKELNRRSDLRSLLSTTVPSGG